MVKLIKYITKTIVDEMDIENIFYNENGYLNRNKLKEKWIKENLSDIYLKIIEFKGNLRINPKNFSQIFYHYLNYLNNYPPCKWCGYDNKRWKSFSSGYKKGCSRSCAIQLSRPKGVETRKRNTKKKYGVDHTSKLDSVKMKKKRTNMEKYNGVAPACSDSVLSKMKSTNYDRYGVEFPLQNPIFYDKLKKTNIERYGVENSLQSDEIKNKIKQNNFIKYGVDHYSMTSEFKSNLSNYHINKSIKNINTDYNNNTFKILKSKDSNFIIKCFKCNTENEINRSAFYLRINRYNTDPCVKCNPLYNRFTSKMEDDLKEFLESKGINVIQSYRKYKREIDLFLPDYKIGIEMNGNYWHSEIYKDKKYHQDKSFRFRERGIGIIHVWEDDWSLKSDIVKSMIISRIDIHKTVINSDDCEISNLSNKDTYSFLSNNNIYGHTNSKMNIGLKYKGLLVSVMSFSFRNNNWKINRFCDILNTKVINSHIKLFNYFKSKVKLNNSIMIYDKLDYVTINDGVYSEMGFKIDKINNPNYYWCKGLNRYPHYYFKKSKLISEGYDHNLSESQIMYSRGYYKSWDSGNAKFIYTL